MNYKIEVNHRKCPVCNSNNYEIVHSQQNDYIIGFDFVDYKNNFVLCKNCGLVYSNPVPTEDELFKYYSNFNNYTNVENNGEADSSSYKKFNRIYQLIQNEFQSNFKGKVLEIGCGTATGLSIFKENGWAVLGIDPSKTASKIAKKLFDIDVIASNFDEKILPSIGKMDVVILSHVLEHLIDPNKIIELMKLILNEKGIIYIEVPNLLKPLMSKCYFSFEHLNYFTVNTLKNLLAKHNLESKIKTFDNSENIEPFYPVISSISKLSKDINLNFINDYELSKKVMDNYTYTLTKSENELKDTLFKILEKFKNRKVAIWGAGLHTTYILNLLEKRAEQIFCFFDNDKQKDGLTLDNKPIYYYENILDIAGKVDCIIISSIIYEDKIYEQLKILENYDIKIFKLYKNEEII